MAPITKHPLEDKQEQWALVRYLNHPGEDFEIIDQSNIIVDADKLEPKMEGKVFKGKVKFQARIIALSDNKEELITYQRRLIDLKKMPIMELYKKILEITPLCNQKKFKYKPPVKVELKLEEPPAAAKEEIESQNTTLKQKIVPKEEEEIFENDNDVIFFGSNKTPIAKDTFENINWNSISNATRQLLMAVFPRDVLGTHTLSGKPSPAFIKAGKSLKPQLDAKKTADIIEVVVAKSKTNCSIVRGHITSKCADENKLLKRKLKEEILDF